MRRSDLINLFLAELEPPTRYLEIGTGSGSSGRLVQASEKWGVDPAYKVIAEHDPKEIFDRFFHGESAEFFAQLNPAEKFDVVFVDGLHLKEQVYQDAVNALAHLTGRGLIVLHDCNPPTEEAQAVPRRQTHWNGDCWKAFVRLRSEHPNLFCRVVVEDQGLGVVIPRPNGVEVKELADLRCSAFDLEFEDLETDRARILGHTSSSDASTLRRRACES